MGKLNVSRIILFFEMVLCLVKIQSFEILLKFPSEREVGYIQEYFRKYALWRNIDLFIQAKLLE